jgi:hypothetical protein
MTAPTRSLWPRTSGIPTLGSDTHAYKELSAGSTLGKRRGWYRRLVEEGVVQVNGPPSPALPTGGWRRKNRDKVDA